MRSNEQLHSRDREYELDEVKASDACDDASSFSSEASDRETIISEQEDNQANSLDDNVSLFSDTSSYLREAWGPEPEPNVGAVVDSSDRDSVGSNESDQYWRSWSYASSVFSSSSSSSDSAFGYDWDGVVTPDVNLVGDGAEQKREEPLRAPNQGLFSRQANSRRDSHTQDQDQDQRVQTQRL